MCNVVFPLEIIDSLLWIVLICQPVNGEAGPHKKEQLQTFQCFSVVFLSLVLGLLKDLRI